MASKLSRMLTCNEWKPTSYKIVQSRGFVRSRDKMFYISTFTRPVATKHGKVVAYVRGVHP